MAYFAQLNDDNTVLQVISINNSVIGEPELSFPETESHGQAFITTLGFDGVWKQTSYNGSFRKRFAGIGYKYDAKADVFIAPQPFPSWILDSDYHWVAPVPCPTEGRWMWDEEAGDWVEPPAGS